MNFSDSALQKLMTSFPELGKLVVSFRDMKEDGGNDAANDIGVFIIKAGPKNFYVPVISQSGTIYPIDSIFDTEDRKFFPLSKATINRILSAQKLELGKSIKTPKTVNQNPSVYDLVTPPKTGKHVYASNGRAPEFLYTIPNEDKQVLLNKIAEDLEFARGLNTVYGITNILEPLQKKAEETPVVPATSESSKKLKVITEGKNLEEDTIQEILENGYSVSGSHANPRLAILSTPEVFDSQFTQIGAAQPGRAYEVVFKNGSTREALFPKTTEEVSPSTLIFNDGSFVCTDRVNDIISKTVILNSEVSYRKVMKDILDFKGSVNILDVEAGNKYMIFDGSSLLGIFSVNTVVANDGFIDLDVRQDKVYRRLHIHVEKEYKGAAFREGDLISIGSECIAIPSGGYRSYDELETNINAASRRKEFEQSRLLEVSMDINHDHGDFTINKKRAGNRVETAKHLILKSKIQPEVAESFIKAAEKSGYARVFMTKQAIHGRTAPAEIPEYGEKAPEAVPISGDKDARQRGMAAYSSAKGAIDTGDKQVVDAVLLSELLQAPALHETITSYLPEIGEAIDKIGRIMLISRMKIDDLSEKMDSGNLSSLLNSLRNTYKMLGENYVKLERLADNAAQES